MLNSGNQQLWHLDYKWKSSTANVWNQAIKRARKSRPIYPRKCAEQLKHWMDDNYQRSVSQAVSLIVEHFLKKDGRPLGDTDLVQAGESS